MSADEWQTVRRRRRNTPADTQRKLGALGIPVVPLSIMTLDNEETLEEKLEAERRKQRNESKKRRKAEQRAQKRQDAEQEEAQQHNTAGTATGPTAPSKASAAGVKQSSLQALSAQPGSENQRPFFLLAWLYACVEWLHKLLNILTGGSKSKARKKPVKPPVSTVPAATSTTGKTTPAGAAMPQPAAKSKASVPVASDAPTSSKQAAAKAPVAPVAPLAPLAPVAPAQPTKGALPAVSKAPETKPSTAAPNAVAAITKATSTTPSKQQQPLQQQQNQPPKPQQTPLKPVPQVKVNPAWSNGHFQLHEVPSAHADVISSVALLGDVFITTGYDSDVQVWRWPVGGPPLVAKHLTGHSGRVEAVCASSASQQAATTGRDSSLRIWDLAAGIESAKEIKNMYVYESVKSLEMDWSSSRAYLGCRSGAICVWDVRAGRKVGVVRGHEEEVTVLRLVKGSGQGECDALFSGCRGGKVVAWRLDLEQGLKQVAAGVVAKGRVAALAVAGRSLYVGDFSSSVKVVDVSALLEGEEQQLVQQRRLPNADVFAGDECPVAGLAASSAAGVLVSSAVSWLEPSHEKLQEAAQDAEQPVGCLHVHTLLEQPEKYLYTVRSTVCNVITCLQHNGEGRMVCGAANGGLLAVQLGQGAQAGEGWVGVKALPIGVEELQEESEDDADDEPGSDDGEA